MIDSNDTTLIPKCRPQASIGVTDAEYTATVTLDSGGGEARFITTTATAANSATASSADVDAGDGDGGGGDYYRFEGQATGIRLIERSAAELAAIRDEYADRNAEKEIFLARIVKMDRRRTVRARQRVGRRRAVLDNECQCVQSP